MTARSDGQGTQKWRRYRRPGEPEAETDAAEGSKPAASKSSSSRGGSPKSGYAAWSKEQDGGTSGSGKSSKKSSGKKSSSRAGWIVGGVIAGSVAIPVAIGAIAATTGDGSDDTPDISTETLDESFVDEALAGAVEVVGNQATSLRLDEYGLEVVAYDPTKDEVHTYTVDTYVDGYTLRVEENAYDDYRPEPFYLDDIEPGVLIAAAEDVIGRIDDPYTYDVSVEPDADTGDISIVADVWDGEDERATVTRDLDGSVVSVVDE